MTHRAGERESLSAIETAGFVIITREWEARHQKPGFTREPARPPSRSTVSPGVSSFARRWTSQDLGPRLESRRGDTEECGVDNGDGTLSGQGRCGDEGV